MSTICPPTVLRQYTAAKNDVLLAIERDEVSGVCLLDLTQLFDTVNHNVLLLRLERTFAVKVS